MPVYWILLYNAISSHQSTSVYLTNLPRMHPPRASESSLITSRTYPPSSLLHPSLNHPSSSSCSSSLSSSSSSSSFSSSSFSSSSSHPTKPFISLHPRKIHRSPSR